MTVAQYWKKFSDTVRTQFASMDPAAHGPVDGGNGIDYYLTTSRPSLVFNWELDGAPHASGVISFGPFLEGKAVASSVKVTNCMDDGISKQTVKVQFPFVITFDLKKDIQRFVEILTEDASHYIDAQLIPYLMQQGQEPAGDVDVLNPEDLQDRPELEPVDQPGSQEAAADEPAKPAERTWRDTDNEREIAKLFPSRPKADELLDLHAKAKELRSNLLMNLVRERSSRLEHLERIVDKLVQQLLDSDSPPKPVKFSFKTKNGVTKFKRKFGLSE